MRHFLVAMLCACAAPRALVPEVGEEAEAILGPAGGELTLGDVRVEVPAGALAEPTTIRITVDAPEGCVPDAFEALSPVYRLEPAGLAFAVPITITLPFVGPGRYATVLSARRTGPPFVARRTEVTRPGVARAELHHLSKTFVGRACEACCGRALADLDLLLVIENGGGLAQEQQSLANELPALVDTLSSGDLNGDGLQDAPALGRLHVGVVTTDMGTGGYEVATCLPNFGDDGVLRREQGRLAPRGSCQHLRYPGVHVIEGDADDDARARFDAGTNCLVQIGTDGCGFEQPLESMLKAVTPSTSALRFEGGTRGHADGANAPFVRPDAAIGVVVLGEEDDCSPQDLALFDPSDTELGDLSRRCVVYRERLQPVTRYAQGLLERRRAHEVAFGVVAGVPRRVEDEALEEILAHPDVVTRFDPVAPSGLRKTCDRPGTGIAFAPVRLLETALALREEGARGRGLGMPGRIQRGHAPPRRRAHGDARRRVRPAADLAPLPPLAREARSPVVRPARVDRPERTQPGQRVAEKAAMRISTLLFTFLVLSSSLGSAQAPKPGVPADDVQPTWRRAQLRDPDAPRTALEERTARVLAREGRLVLKVGLLAGAINYVDNESFPYCAEWDRDRERCERYDVHTVQHDRGWEPQGGFDFFIGMRIGEPKELAYHLGYSLMVTATPSALMQRHMGSIRISTPVLRAHGGGGLMIWHRYDGRRQMAATAFLEFSVPLGRRGYYLGLPIVMEFPFENGRPADDAAASVSLSFGYSLD